MKVETGGDEQPLYQQIYADLTHKITTGELRYMEQIPSLPELCKHYHVSESSVRRAIDELARDGLVVKRRGRGQGTFVTKRLTPMTLRVLLLAGFDIYRSTVATCHEMFDLLDGIREAAAQTGSEVHQVSSSGFDTLPPSNGHTAYLVIAMTWKEYEEGARLAAQHQAPCVLVNPPQAGYSCVRVDMEHGMFLGANYLAQLGHQRIAYIGGTHSEWSHPRFRGYRHALQANTLAFDADLVCETDGIDPEQDQRALHRLLAHPNPPTALVASSDYRALHLLSACRELGIRVPEDLSICGYDNIGEVANVEPPLTTVVHPRREQGQVAVDLAYRLLHQSDRSEPVEQIIRPTLVIRRSCTSPRRAGVLASPLPLVS